MKMLAALFFLISAMGPVLAGQKPELWLISGQSNACGWVNGAGPASDPRVEMPAKNGWVPAKEPFSFLGSKGVGAWHTAALSVVKSGVPSVRLCGSANPGKPISFWSNSGPGWAGLKGAIASHGKNADVFFWYQGESDANAKMSTADYKAKLTELVNRVRTESGNPNQLAVIVQLARWKPNVAGAEAIREAQREFAISDARAILVPANPYESDGVHLTRAGYFGLGEALGSAMLRVRSGKDASAWPGPVMDAVAATAGGNGAIVHFAEVNKLADVRAGDFCAIDGGGQVKCTNAVAKNTVVALTFERALQTPARVIYGYCETEEGHLKDEAGNFAPSVSLSLNPGPAPADAPSIAPNGAGPSKP